MSIASRASRIRLMLFDVDGVLTDGKILLHADGTESKQFDIKDGTGLVWAQRAGLKVGSTAQMNTTRWPVSGPCEQHRPWAIWLTNFSVMNRSSWGPVVLKSRSTTLTNSGTKKLEFVPLPVTEL
jgi:hypothetical protein